MRILPSVIIREVKGKGRGLFAAEAISRGALIDRCPVLLWPRGAVPDDYVYRYVWEWRGQSAVALGVTSLCNHDKHPNVGSRRIYARRAMEFRALRWIQPGEELTLDYGPSGEEFDGG